MSETRKFYVICEDNCKFESMTKEQIIAAIAEATGNTPTDIDAAFISKILEQNANKPVKIWVGTQAEFNALIVKDPDTLYIYNDTSIEDLQAALENIINGTTFVGNATNAVNAEEAAHATNADNAANAMNAENAEKTDISNSTWSTNKVTDLKDFELGSSYQLIAFDGDVDIYPFFFYALPYNIMQGDTIKGYFEFASTVITKADTSNNLTTITECKVFGEVITLPSGSVGSMSLKVTKSVYNKSSSGFVLGSTEDLPFIYRKIR